MKDQIKGNKWDQDGDPQVRDPQGPRSLTSTGIVVGRSAGCPETKRHPHAEGADFSSKRGRSCPIRTAP